MLTFSLLTWFLLFGGNFSLNASQNLSSCCLPHWITSMLLNTDARVSPWEFLTSPASAGSSLSMMQLSFGPSCCSCFTAWYIRFVSHLSPRQEGDRTAKILLLRRADSVRSFSPEKEQFYCQMC